MYALSTRRYAIANLFSLKILHSYFRIVEKIYATKVLKHVTLHIIFAKKKNQDYLRILTIT